MNRRFVVVLTAPGSHEPYSIIDTHADPKNVEARHVDSAETEEEAQDMADQYEAAPHTA